MLLSALLSGCRSDPIAHASVTAAGDALPLTFLLDLHANEPVSVDVRWSDGVLDRAISLPETRALADQPLFGFRPGQTAEIRISVTDAHDRSVELDPIEVTTRDLEGEERPDIEVVASDPDRMEPGYTLVPRWGSSGLLADGVAVLDPAGDVVYLLHYGSRLTDARVIDGGLQLLVGETSLEIHEIDWLGHLKRAFHSAAFDGAGLPVDLPGPLHHDDVAMPDGGYVVLSKRLREVPNYPISYEDPSKTADVSVSEDVVDRFGPDGAIVWEQPLGDLLDLTRIGFDSLAPSAEDGAPDWAHANALWVEPDGHVGVSMRQQDAIARFDPGDGTLDWILGTHANWKEPWADSLLTPVGELEWPSHQHAAHLARDGTITLFDNGNYRASPGEVSYGELTPESERRSVVSSYEVDADARTVRQVRSLDLTASVGGPVFSEALGGADVLPNGDVLGVYGRIEYEGGRSNTELGYAPNSVRIVEWDPSGREVFHVHLTTDPVALPDGWDSYRVERFAGFPGD